MNLKILIISFFLTIQAQEMIPQEEAIVAFMERPESSLGHGENEAKSIKHAYLLLVPGWKDLGSSAFMKKMSAYVQSFDEVLRFRQFMEGKEPINPTAHFIHNEDGSWYSVKRFSTNEYSYVLSEHSYLPGWIIIEERNTGMIIKLERDVVYPVILCKK